MRSSIDTSEGLEGFAKSVRAATIEEIASFVETHYCVMVPPYGPNCAYKVEARPKHPREPLAMAIRGLKEI